MRRAGHSGLHVSELGLGTLTWGRDTDSAEAQEMLNHFLEAGGNLVDIAPTHGDGLAIDVVGTVTQNVNRNRLVIALRGGGRIHTDGTVVPSEARGDLLTTLDDTLKRLNTEFIDLWLVGPDRVPLEESLDAIDVALATGRVRYAGVSHRGMWDSASAVTLGQTRIHSPITMFEERLSLLALDSAPLIRQALDSGIGVLAHSPLAGGVLTGKYRHSTPPDSRAASPHLRYLVEPWMTSEALHVVEALVRAAQGLDRTPMDVALTWVKDTPGITSAIIGPRTTKQLDLLVDGGDPLPTTIRQVLTEVAAQHAGLSRV